MKQRIEYLLKNSVVVQSLYRFVGSTILRIVALFVKMDDGLVLFNSFGGRAYNDSPKVIYETMLRDTRFEQLNYVWAFQDPSRFRIPGCRIIRIDSLEYFLTALRAKYWVSSVNIERGLCFKRKNTRYLNSWHGAGTKKIGRALRKRRDINFSNVDIMLVQSEYEKEIFKRDFLVNEDNCLMCGLPRSDELFAVSDDDVIMYRATFGIPHDKRVLLYAPTWRESANRGSSYELAPPINIKKWRDFLSDEYILLFRTHAFTTKVLNLEFDEFVRDVSKYPDINHLLVIADVLVTDYSTVIFDYSILEKPFACFGYDYDEYKEERGFYFDFRQELPNGVFETEDEVLTWILNMNPTDECMKSKAFKARYIENGGNAAKCAIDALMAEYDDRK